VSYCVTAPGGTAGCSHISLPAGQRTATATLALPRIGDWSVALTADGANTVVRNIWVSHPGGRIELYAAGDSEMQYLDGDLSQALSPDRVRVTADARPATGLTKSFLFNWLTEARRKAAKLRPDVSIVSMGANDGYGLTGATGPVMCCGASWSAAYGVLAAKMMKALLRHGAGRVYWVLLAAPQPQPFPALIDAVNAGIRQAAARFPGHVGLIDANAFFTPGDQYRDTMTYNGQTFTIHETDGVHLSPAADTVLAQLIEQRLIADRVIR
jgi:hypothetical protein